MAQTGYTPILIYSSSTTTNAPAAGSLTNSTLGSELAINITDGKLFYKDNANAVQVIAWKTTPTTAGGTGLTSYTAGDLLYYASGTTLTKLAIGSAYQALQVNAGGTAPSWQASATSTLTAQGDLLYASAANTLARLAKNTTATRYLSNTGTSNNPAWAQVDLTNGVTGTLPTTNGGTGLTSFTANALVSSSSTSALTTANSLYTDNAGRLALGTNNLSGQAFRVSVTNFAAVPSGFYCNDGDGNAEQFGITRVDATNGRGIRFQTTLDGSNLPYYTISTGTAASTIAGMTWTERFRVNTSGNVQLSGNLGLGGTTPTTSGTGITFPATQSASTEANTLDDYEEGTWSPSVGGTATYTVQQGHYVKVGQLVYIFFDLEINAIGTGSTASITNAPFTAFDSPTNTGYTVNISYHASLANTITWLTGYIADNSTSISFAGNSTAAATIQNNGFAVFGNSARIVGSACYRASA